MPSTVPRSNCLGHRMNCHKSLRYKGFRIPSTDPVSNALDTGCAFCKSFIHKELRLPWLTGVPVSKGGVVCTTPILPSATDHRFFSAIRLEHTAGLKISAAVRFKL